MTGYDAASPFTKVGLLEGAAGVALALHGGLPPVSGWDAALLAA